MVEAMGCCASAGRARAAKIAKQSTAAAESLRRMVSSVGELDRRLGLVEGKAIHKLIRPVVQRKGYTRSRYIRV